MEIRLDGQVAVITGASQGIGRSTARMLAVCGASVIVNYHSSTRAAEELVSEVEAGGGKAIAIKADVTRRPEVDALVDKALAAFNGRIDILVNNAGGLVARKPFHEYPEELLQTVLGLNVYSAFYACQAVIPIMMKQGYGRIVNFTSQAARTGGGIGAVPYAMSKGAISTMTRGLAKELAPHGITVNAVSPGLVDTPFHEKFTPQDVLKQQATTVPLGRLAHPDECASAVLYLVSRLGSYVTGEIMEVNGGMLMD